MRTGDLFSFASPSPCESFVQLGSMVVTMLSRVMDGDAEGKKPREGVNHTTQGHRLSQRERWIWEGTASGQGSRE